MNGSNTPPTPPKTDLRTLAIELVEAISDHLTDNRGLWQLASDVRAAAERPERSRPGLLPDVDHALGAIAAMKAGKPIAPEDIHQIVALAETGAEELASFDVRWNADMRAIARWRETHPGNDLVLPDHADLVVWLMDVFDTTFSTPTVAQVEHVRARLGAAQLRAPNQLTKDARDIVDQLTDALRKTSRRAFMAEERARAAEAQNVQWEQSEHRGITHRPAPLDRATIRTIYEGRPRSAMDSDFDALVAEARKAGIVDDSAKTIWRQPGQAGALLATKLGQLTGYPVKDRTGPTADHLDLSQPADPVVVPLDDHLATAPHADCADCRAMEADPLAETIAKAVGDMTVWPNGPNDETTLRELLASSFVADADLLNRAAAIASATILGHADTEGDALALAAHLDCPICGGSGHIDDAKERLHERLVDLLTRELGDAFDCTRVWSAWEVGTMTADDFESVTDRLDDLVEGLIAQLTAPDQVEADRASLDRMEARLDAEVLATVPAVERDPVPGVYSADQGDEVIGGKNTADYDRRQMEERINDIIQRQAISGPLDIGEIGDVVHRIAPGWEWAQVPLSDPPQIALVRNAPGEPL